MAKPSKKLTKGTIGFDGLEPSEVWIDELLEKTPAEIAAESAEKKAERMKKSKKSEDDEWALEITLAINGFKNQLKSRYDKEDILDYINAHVDSDTDELSEDELFNKTGPKEFATLFMNVSDFIVEDEYLINPELYDSTYGSVFINRIAKPELFDALALHVFGKLTDFTKEHKSSKKEKTVEPKENTNGVYVRGAFKADDRADSSIDPSWGSW